MLLIYSSEISSRLKYITETLFRDFSGVEVYYTNSNEEFRNFDGAKINYSYNTLAEDELHLIPASSLLFENNIVEVAVPVRNLNHYKILFPCAEGDFSFDIFAASFFLLSRYEEYLPHKKDVYGRFAHTESIAFKESFLDVPLINYWLQDFQKVIQARFPFLLFTLGQFRFIPTYDIDIAFSYLHKGFTRSAGGAARSLLKGEIEEFKQRFEVIAGKKNDPFDVYELLYALHLKHNLNPYYFFLVATSPGEYDKNIDPSHPEMQELIKFHALGYNVGIHPSWQSGDNDAFLVKEISTLEALIERKVIHSRQHYIRMTVPETYRKLINLGILNEFSMGYGSINGFRASVASAFYWYDLAAEKKTSLLVYPFCFMDANSFYEQKLTPQQAFDEICRYHDTIKKVNGTMITIWHNNFFGSDKMFAGWREVYQLFLEEVLYWDI